MQSCISGLEYQTAVIVKVDETGFVEPRAQSEMLTAVSNFVSVTTSGLLLTNPQPTSHSDPFIHCTPLQGAPTGTAFRAIESATGRQVEIRYLPWLRLDNDRRENLQSQLILQSSVLKSQARRLVESTLSSETPRLVMRDVSTESSDLFPSQASVVELLQLSANLVDTVSRALTARLYHGSLTSQSIRIIRHPNPCCIIDYLEPFYTPDRFELATGDSYHRDLLGALRIIVSWLNPIIIHNDVQHSISPRKLSILRQLLQVKLDRETLDDVWNQWTDFLSDWFVEPSEASGTGQIAHSDFQNTAEVEVFKNWAHHQTPASLEDGNTCEVNVHHNSLHSIPPKSIDATDVMDDESLPPAETNRSNQATSVLLSPGTQLGRFRLEMLVGKGGMGEVYRGTDMTNNKTVAIKVLQYNGSDITQAVRRFKKEARILASVQNEFVTQLFEVGFDKGFHYLAMEFIDGINLKEWMRSHSPLDESLALKLVSDIAKALMGAHDRQIIHRDIKPDNVLMARRHGVSTTEVSQLEIHDLTVKLTDFGIARQIQQASSMEVTRAGAFLGTPLYMAPEQCKGSGDLGPTADIYSLGITLYELLTGEPPFQSPDPMKLAAMHCFDAVPDVRKRNRKISDTTFQLLSKMLAKSPSDRIADAHQLIREIDRVVSGEIHEFESHPRLPDVTQSKIWERIFRWNLQSSAKELWPHVSNTDRLNRAAGLPAVKYRTEKDPQRGLRKFGSFRLGGIQIEWEEHPFEWIEGTRMGVFREFSSGPFKWFMNSLELKPLPNGGTELIHTVRIEPRNTLGRVVSTVEAGWKGGRALDRIYNRIDKFCQDQQQLIASSDPFEEVHSLKTGRKARLEQRLERMNEKGISFEVTQKICDFIQSAAPQALAKVRPLQLAAQLNIPDDETVEACLVAANVGLLVMQWDILCPTCRASARSESMLSSIQQHTECEACDVEFQSNLGNAIELVFRVHPEIREAEDAKYCVGGPGHSPHVVSQLNLSPGERIELTVPLDNGDYLVRGGKILQQQSIHVRDGAGTSRLDLKLSQFGLCQPTPTLRSGRTSLCLTNDTESRQLIRLERTIERTNVVTASAVASMSRFRELFPEQTFQKNMPIASDDVTLVACELNNADEIYAALGDSDAYSLIVGMLQEMESLIATQRGAVVKTTGQGLLASFQDCASATRAASLIMKQFQHHPSGVQPELGIAVHRGRTLVSTQNGRIDYFGASTRLATQLASQMVRCIALTDAVFSDALAQQCISQASCSSEMLTVSLSSSSKILIQKLFFNHD